MTIYESDQAPLRRLKSVGAVLLASSVLVVAGCGGSDTPAVCSGLETLSSDVDELQSKDLTAGEGAVAEIDKSIDTIRTDLQTVKADSEAELSAPIADLESSLDTLSADVKDAQATGDITGEAAQGLLDSLAAVNSSWVALKDSVPDCDL